MRNEKTLIVHVITGLNLGGAETMLFKLLSNMDSNKFENIVISLSLGGHYKSKLEEIGISVIELDLKKALFRPWIFLIIIGQLKKLRLSVLQGWMYHGNLVASVLKCLIDKNIRLYWNIRQGMNNNEKKTTRLLIFLLGYFSFLPDKIINNSESSIEIHKNEFGFKENKFLLISNGFDTEKLNPNSLLKSNLRLELGLSTDTILVGTVGRYHKMKDYPNLIFAAKILMQEFENVHFVLIGKDLNWENEELASLISENDLSDKFTLLGHKDEVEKLMCTFDVYVSPSYSEGFPNVIGEAMSLGIPCIVTDAGDSAIIVGRTGYVVPIQNPQELACAFAKFIQLSRNDKKSMGIEARQKIIDEYSIDMVTNQYASLYELELKVR